MPNETESATDEPLWRLVCGRALEQWWGVQHWMRTRLLGLAFCHSCSGYFLPTIMPEPDTCEACYRRDYGLARER